MTDPLKNSEEIQKKLSRSRFLRDSVFAATGVVLLPSFIAGCNKIQIMTSDPNTWIGGFSQSNPAFAYPNPDLSSLPMLDNMANIKSLRRQQAAIWPEFSWESQKGEKDPKRVYQMFAPDISRLGYTNTGRIYAIICPQQGICYPGIGCMNVEVTVTGQRGWVDETTRKMAADMTVEGKIWFTPLALQNPTVQKLWDAFKNSNLPFPSTKQTAIRITTHKYQTPDQPIFPVHSGLTDLFKSPDFAIHEEAWATANVQVEIGPIVKTNSALVDSFNQLVLDFFNLASGNMLQNGNLLSWNIFFTGPAIVDTKEWTEHAEKWRESIDVNHGSPDGNGSDPKYFDGSPFNAVDELIAKKIEELLYWIWQHL